MYSNTALDMLFSLSSLMEGELEILHIYKKLCIATV